MPIPWAPPPWLGQLRRSSRFFVSRCRILELYQLIARVLSLAGRIVRTPLVSAVLDEVGLARLFGRSHPYGGGRRSLGVGSVFITTPVIVELGLGNGHDGRSVLRLMIQ